MRKWVRFVEPPRKPRRRVWIIEPTWAPLSPWMTECIYVMSGKDTHVGYYYKGKPANIFGVVIVCRQDAWWSIEKWFREKWFDGTIGVWLIVSFGLSVLGFATWAVMHHEGML